MPCLCGQCKTITVSRHGTQYPAVLPSWLPSAGWTVHNRGYLIYSSRATRLGLTRGVRAHRLVIAMLIPGEGYTLPVNIGMAVHHQDFDKLNNCPLNLIYMDQAFNPSPTKKDPYTGEYMSIAAWERRYGSGSGASGKTL